MTHCPFCQTEVPQNLLTYGGACPKCFGMIPGEEAPTDPGEAVRKAQSRADDKVRRRRAFLPMLFAIPMVALACGLAGLAVLWPDPEVVPIVFDDELDMGTIAVAYLEAPVGQPAPDPLRVAPNSARPRPRPTPVPGVAGSPAPEPEPAAPVPSVGPSPQPSSQAGFGVEQTLGRRAGTLTDPDQIREMIKKRMTEQSGRLKACYEERLKTRGSLSGKWLISFVVTAKGGVDKPAVKGATVTDAEFESCLVRELGRWTFNPISHDQPAQRTLSFTQ